MKIFHVITGLDDGGAEAVLYRLVGNDPANTHHVVSLAGDGKYVPLLRQVGAEVTILGMPRGRVTLRGLYGLWRAVRSWQPDVIQTWMYHADLLGGLAGRLASVPVVWGIRNTTLEPGRSSRATIWVARVCAKLSRWVPARIVTCAEKARDTHAALGYDAGRMVVIPNGYDLSRFFWDAEARDRLRAEWGVSNDCPLIGMVGRFDPFKDHPNLIAALERLESGGVAFEAVLVGTGMDTSNSTLPAWLADAGVVEHVRLLGPRSDIPAVMSALDLHVLSSSAEGFPNVLAEAMACGTPCVTTNVGDAALIVGDTGWVVPPRNDAALADGLCAALTASKQCADWRERQRCARQRIEDEFGMGKMVERYRNVWAQVPGRSR